ncbi:IS200/IS605 family accessory protein TnpB-related protein, partial [Archaeoglobus sp.]
QRKEYYENLSARRQQRLMKVFGIKDKDFGHKDRNYVNDLNHKIAKELVLTAKRMRKAIVIERLKGLKRSNMKSRSRKIRKILHR